MSMEFCNVCGNPHATCSCQPPSPKTVEMNLAQCANMANKLIEKATNSMKFAERLAHDLESVSKDELLWLQQMLTFYYVPLEWRNSLKEWIDRLDGKNNPLKTQQQVVLVVFFTELLIKIEGEAPVCKACGQLITSPVQTCLIEGPIPGAKFICRPDGKKVMKSKK